MAAHTGAAVSTSALSKRFGRAVALDALTLDVAAGSIFGVIGPNGAGKTTALRLLLDIIRPTSGSALVLGVDPRIGGPELRRRIGYLPGELRLEGRITGRNLLDQLARISGPVAPGAIDTLAERVGLDLTRQVRTLSKGNKQKLGIVQAFMHTPDLLVLDEPTSGLDPLVQQTFLVLVTEAAARGQTVIVSSHVLSEIEQVADRVAIMRAGRVVRLSSVQELRQSAARHVRATLSGTDVATVRAALEADGALSALSTLSAGLSADSAGISEPLGTGSVCISGTLNGSIDRLVKLLAGFTVVDLRIEEPDLEESVLALYRDDEPGSTREHHRDDHRDGRRTKRHPHES
ncbi:MULTISPECIES: ABC transporter ATP-binding protein [Subtercola]|uniref:ABC transporter ATP-binding protein n=1 Tax=Subtercola vilae TaxID=2056433 RepID=A0A4T2CBG1_9MICO|nr:MULTISPECIES: ABC transporter ATP-binding protein [Subtercola]MEA9984380.1 ABC transporter ATP-binding protein [Subtercola sp. RTI3]TIH40056.1 ABC transporter ATP-binding protein [Subtercola vilae]